MKVCKSIELYPNMYELMLNTLRLLSKISLSFDCCREIFKNAICVKNLISFFKTYKTNIYIIIRVSFILA